MSDDDYSSSGDSFGGSAGGGDSYSERSTQSLGSRLGSAIKGVLFGVILFLGAFPLLWWNEGRAVHTAQGLIELGRNVVSTTVDKVETALEGKPVHLTGQTAVSEVLADPEFPVSATAVRLRRVVQMFQWKEEEHTEKRKRAGGSEETVRTWTYRKQWVDHVIDSSRFKKSAEHRNPSAMRFPGREQAAKVVRVGAFRLSPSLIGQADNFEPLPLDTQRLGELSEQVKRSLKVDGLTLYASADAKGPAPDPASPRIGDLKIRFEVVRPGPVSVIAQQAGDSFVSWRSKAGTYVDRLEPSTKSAAEMIDQMMTENNILTWVLRLVGLVVMTLGLALVLNPIAVLADVLPILGQMLRFGVFVGSLLMASCLSLLTIALAWLAYRPMLAGVLIAIVVALIVWVRKAGGTKKAVQPPPIPPIPPVKPRETV